MSVLSISLLSLLIMMSMMSMMSSTLSTLTLRSLCTERSFISETNTRFSSKVFVSKIKSSFLNVLRKDFQSSQLNDVTQS